MTGDANDVTIGELSRGLTRVEREVQHGFAAIRQEISALSFVPPAVYAADMTAQRERVARIEQDLADEAAIRREAETTGQQRAWQAKWSIILALVTMPLSIVGAVAAGLLIAVMK